jgi:SRSO17 transposase
LDVIRARVLPLIERHGPIRHWIIDDTGVPKKGKHSVGVARQYCGQLGKQDNCQVAVTLSVANEHASLPIAYRLYLPEPWTADRERRGRAGVPEDIVFQTKPQIALAQLRAAVETGVPRGVVLSDAGYGNDTDFRTGLTEQGLLYVVGVQSSTSLWPPGQGPLPPKPWRGKGPLPKRMRRDEGHQPTSALDVAKDLPAQVWRTIRWREGTNAALSSRFAAVRVRPAHRDYRLSEPHPQEWLLIEWPDGETEPTKYWLSTVPADTPMTDLAAAAKGRWCIERDYRDLKQEVGLGHFEGRGWRGFHHHASLCIAAYGFLVAERCLFPPEQRFQTKQLAAPAIPAGYRPRGTHPP